MTADRERQYALAKQLQSAERHGCSIHTAYGDIKLDDCEVKLLSPMLTAILKSDDATIGLQEDIQKSIEALGAERALEILESHLRKERPKRGGGTLTGPSIFDTLTSKDKE